MGSSQLEGTNNKLRVISISSVSHEESKSKHALWSHLNKLAKDWSFHSALLVFSITPDSLLCKSESGPSRTLSVKLSLCPYLCLSESVCLLCLSDHSLAEGFFFYFIEQHRKYQWGKEWGKLYGNLKIL